VGGKPNAGMALDAADWLLKELDPARVADDVRMHGEQIKPASLSSRSFGEMREGVEARLK
jgi:hypothetical protein